mmetsp:Transcript_56158/g.159858  ORF Transcript_56158/g.159858 Transcript_56158/m.159858 type:complete len:425 (+) Transcript_56158:286-1560(+)
MSLETLVEKSGYLHRAHVVRQVRWPLAPQLRVHDLPQFRPPSGEGGSAAHQVMFPKPSETLRVLFEGVALEVPHVPPPLAQRLRVAETKAVPVLHVPAVAEILRQVDGVWQLSSWKHVSVHEAVVVPFGAPLKADRVQEHNAIVGETIETLVEIGAIVIPADVLEHTDGIDPIELPFDQPVVLQPVFHVRVREVILGELQLVLRERAPVHVHAILGGQVVRERAVATAYLQHAHAWPQVQLLGDEIHLGPLCLVQRHLGPVKVGAGVLHGRPQHAPVHLGAAPVVVGGDVALRAPAVLQPVLREELPLEHPDDGAEQQGQAQHAQLLRVPLDGFQLQQLADQPFVIVRLPLAVHERLSEAEVALGQEPSQDVVRLEVPQHCRVAFCPCTWRRVHDTNISSGLDELPQNRSVSKLLHRVGGESQH